MNYLFKTALAISILAMFSYVNAQAVNIVVYGKHVLMPNSTIKVAEYKFEINNLSKDNVQQLDIGCYNPDQSKTQAQFAYEWEKHANGNRSINKPAHRTTSIFPTGWQFEVLEVHGAPDYCLELRTIAGMSSYGIPAGKSTKNTGQNFVFRLVKLDPNYVKAFVRYEYGTPIIKAQPFDTIAPKLSYHLETHQHGKHHHVKHRHGWTQVMLEDVVITDNYDPLPVVLLTSVTSKDPTFKPEDVDAIYNEETKSFWVKRTPNRQYTVTYTGMDASGNKVEVSRNIWAY